MRALIIEPSRDLAKVISGFLMEEGINADIAHTAQAGLSCADENRPDVVIIELLISDHNGLEFIHEFKSYQDWFDVPIVVYSDLSSEELGVAVGWKEDMNIQKHFYKPTTTLKELKNFIKTIPDEN